MNLELIKKLCELKEENLYTVLVKFLHVHEYTKIIRNKDFILAEGNIPVCLVAHMDTVFISPPKGDDYLYDTERQILWHPGGSGFDDRAGIYAILELVMRGLRPHILFTRGEEKGGIGAQAVLTRYSKFPFGKLKLLIEIDRANEKDAVFYDCDNEDLINYIEKEDFVFDFGTFTDISFLMDGWKVGGVNLSTGYEDEHTQSEKLHCDWLDATIDKVEKILRKVDKMPYFKYVPMQYPRMIYNWGDDQCVICGTPTKYKAYGMPVCDSCYREYY